jgi:hypothetical protein
MNPFSIIVNAFRWLGHELITWVPRGFLIAEDVVDGAEKLLPEGVQLLSDVNTLALDVIKDAGQAVGLAESVFLAIREAAAAGIVDVAADEAVVAAFQALVTHLDDKSTWVDVIAGLKTLATDYNTFIGAAKAAEDAIVNDAHGG